MTIHRFDFDVSLRTRKEMAPTTEALDWLDLELDVRESPGDLNGSLARQAPVAGSLTCGNTCGVLSTCAGSGCGGVTCGNTCGVLSSCAGSGCGGVTCNCTGGCGDFSNGCDG